MANLTRRKNKHGNSWIIELNVDGYRKSIFLPSAYTEAQAQEVRLYAGKVEKLALTGMDADVRTQTWLTEMSDDLRERFVKIGLLTESKRVTLGVLWERFLKECESQAKRNDKKDSTVSTYYQAKNHFFEFFDTNADANELDVTDCNDWKQWLLTQGYNGKPYQRATVATTMKRCRVAWNWAKENGFCSENPFLKVSIPSMVNDERLYFVDSTAYRKMLEACPDQSLRVYLALLRYGGLRAAEPRYLRWSDVNWELKRLVVHSPKTARHEGKDKRIIPIFPELMQELEVLFDQSEVGGSPFILDQLQDRTMTSVRNRVERVLFNAGLEQWPRLFQNLRSSRATELQSEFPAHVIAAWMGHSLKVEAKHYLMVRDEDFDRATACQAVNRSGKVAKLAIKRT